MVNITVHILPTGPLETNCIVLHDGSRATVVDPGMGAADLVAEVVEKDNVTVEQIVLTHGHIDHIRDLPQVQTVYAVPSHMHPADNPWLDREALDAMGPLGEMHSTDTMDTPQAPSPVADGDVLPIAGVDFTAHLMPGHSPGSVMYRGALPDGRTIVLGGDVLFRGGVGRTDLPLSDPAAMVDSLRRIVGEGSVFGDADEVVPGHGPSTTIGRERRENGFLQGVV
ncbi:MAG: MBL fold metallo-hydrolase [Mycobacteriaceae bacterium]|uniref:MBL fold metallo-hydrolase n=1 Tax=Corynebacterium sp. TaxID=1720 RepID=UPI003F9C8745